jgi:pantoate--beta-alanine ligase
MYPAGYQTYVQVEQLSQGLCGASRPGHFRGVATVVLKLFNAVQPHVALFGMKDYQQLQVIKRMSRDLDLGVEIVGMPIVREPDGLALSSRNAYLSPDERLRALALSRALGVAHDHVGMLPWVTAENIVDNVRTTIHMTHGVRIDYVEVRDADTLEPVSGKITRPVVIAVAAFVGNTRLIDNVVWRP